MKLFLCLILISIVIPLTVNSQRCGRNEILNSCGGRCELNCGDPESKPCPLVCDPPKCTCATGYRRDLTTGRCVKPAKCPTRPTPPKRCGENEILDQCGGQCELKCGDPENKPCPSACFPPECTCARGFRRDTVTGRCVRPAACTLTPRPTTTQKPQKCGKNEIYTTCSSACEPTCGVEDKVCPAKCGPPKCECLSGYRRNPKNGQCVTQSQCPITGNSLACGINEVSVQCPPRCEPTCNNLNTSCPAVCGKPGCVCASGYVRAPISGECIKMSECFPSTSPGCQKNEIFTTCSTPCEPTCKDPNPTCVRRCDEPKCQCSVGYVRNTKTGDCILQSECSTSQPDTKKCQNNEIFVTCSTLCEPSCDNRNPICVKRCGEPKCQCLSGFYRNTNNGRCVDGRRCPLHKKK